jgi:K+-sensing histidine kinase KdpD
MDVLIRNLIENAVKYAEVTLDIRVHSGKVELQIVNQSSSEMDWNSERLFEPFARPDSSRNFKTGGVGLGLTICKAITDANRWQFSLQREEHIVRVTVVLPELPA